MAQNAPSFRIFVDGCDSFYGRLLVSTFRRDGHIVIGACFETSSTAPKSARKPESEATPSIAETVPFEDDPLDSARRSHSSKDAGPPKAINAPLLRMGFPAGLSKKSDPGSARAGKGVIVQKAPPSKMAPSLSIDFSETLDMSPNETVPLCSPHEMQDVLLSCDVVVLSVLEEATRAVEIYNILERAVLETPIHLILISSFLTWAKTPVDMNSTADPITETEFRRRQPHPGFRWQYEAEKTFSKSKNKGLKINVVTTGLLYGCGEDIFYQFFKQIWSDGRITCIGDGRNRFPTIHVRDFSTVVNEIVKRKPNDPYIFACDEGSDTFKDKIMALCNATMSGYEEVGFEDAIIQSNLTLMDLDRLHLNLEYMSLIVPEWDMRWRYRKGFTAGIISILQEFKVVHSLSPIKVFVRGPPSSGKSYLSTTLAKSYNLAHLSVASVIASILETDCDAAAEAKRFLEDLSHRPNTGKHAPVSNKFPDDILIKIFKERMKYRDCLVHGFILDGFPKTLAQAQMLFTDTAISEEGPKPVEILVENPSRLPTHILNIEATLERLKENLQSMDCWSAPMPSHNNDEGLQRRMAVYLQQQQPEKFNPLSFFADREAVIVSTDAFLDYYRITNSLTSMIGPKRVFGNLHPDANTLDTENFVSAEPNVSQPSRLNFRTNEGSIATRSDKSPIPFQQLSLLQMSVEEDELLKSLAVPLRQFLLDTVLPVLADSLIEISQERPEYPIRTLANMILRARRRREHNQRESYADKDYDDDASVHSRDPMDENTSDLEPDQLVDEQVEERRCME